MDQALLVWVHTTFRELQVKLENGHIALFEYVYEIFLRQQMARPWHAQSTTKWENTVWLFMWLPWVLLNEFHCGIDNRSVIADISSPGYEHFLRSFGDFFAPKQAQRCSEISLVIAFLALAGAHSFVWTSVRMWIGSIHVEYSFTVTITQINVCFI